MPQRSLQWLGWALVLQTSATFLACSAPRDDDQPRPGSVDAPGTPTGAGTNAQAGTSGGPAGSSSSEGGNAARGEGGTAGASPSAGATGGASIGGDAAMPPSEACAFPHLKLTEVHDSQELVGALATAKPGTLIQLPDAELRGAFKAVTSGNAQQPIILCGSRQALLSASSGGAVLTIEGDYWVASGFSVTGGLKGVLLDGANHALLTGLSVHGIGNEGVHFRANSADNTLEWSEVFDTGNASAEFGEGVYVGSAMSQWAKFTGSADVPDRSDRNVIRNNRLGPNVRAELIDVKEGTSSGIIRDNVIDGTGIVSGGFADSWVDVKGSGYSVVGNTGTNAPNDGFQVHVIGSGWGDDNTFQKNHAGVNAKGYGFRISDGSHGTVVGCDNEVTGAGAGLSNIGCQN